MFSLDCRDSDRMGPAACGLRPRRAADYGPPGPGAPGRRRGCGKEEREAMVRATGDVGMGLGPAGPER